MANLWTDAFGGSGDLVGYTEDSVHYAQSGGNCIVADDATAQRGRAIVDSVSGETDMDIYFDFQYQSSISRGWYVCGRDNGATSGNVGYGCGINNRTNHGFTANQLAVYIAQHTLGDVDSIIASVTPGVSLSSGSWYTIHFQLEGTALRARVWAQGDTEPSTWDIDTTDSTYSSGGIAIGSYNSGNRSINMDNFVADSISSGTAYDETGLSLTGISTVTGSDALTMGESLAITATSTLTGSDVAALAESLATAITSAVIGTDGRGLAESLAVAVASTVTGVDIFAYNELGLAVAVASTLASADTLTAVDNLAATATSTVGSSDTLAAVDSYQVAIASTVTGSDGLIFDESGRLVDVVSTVAGSDAVAGSESLAIGGTTSVSGSDALTGTESLGVTILESDTLIDTLSGMLFESLQVDIVSAVTGSDLAALLDSLAVTGVTSVSGSDIWTIPQGAGEAKATVTDDEALAVVLGGPLGATLGTVSAGAAVSVGRAEATIGTEEGGA